MIESSDVLGCMKLVYVIYTAIVFSLMGMYAFSITRHYRLQPKFKVPFYGWLAFLIVSGVGIHVLTFNVIPWVKWDLSRDSMKVDREYRISLAGHRFHLPEEKLVINEGEMVRFELESKDYTYGFGLFREDESMVFQMQVVPDNRNDIVWKFDKPGVYSIRSTEYSGPKGGNMLVQSAVVVSPESAATATKVGNPPPQGLL